MIERLLRLSVGKLPHLNAEEKLDVWRNIVQDPDRFASFLERDWESVIPSHKREGLQYRELFRDARKDHEKMGSTIQVVCLADREYPVLLKETYAPPFLIFYRGTLPPNTDPLVAIVGTRKATEEGRHAAFCLGANLGKHGIAVISGLAYGIDASAHTGNLVGGGKTIAVLGSGVDCIYPRDHETLARSILEKGGALCSELSPGTPPLRYHFPRRNRLVSGMARTIFLIEAPHRSGALITASCAIEEGRDLFVHPRGLDSPLGAGGAALVEQGAVVGGDCQALLASWGVAPDDVSPVIEVTGEKNIAHLMEKELTGAVTRFEGRYYCV